MTDECYRGQVMLITAKLTNPASTVAPLDPVTGETLTDDPTETLKAFRQDGTAGTISATVHGTTGYYTAQVTTDQDGWWQVNDGKGGLYEFYVRPIRT